MSVLFIILAAFALLAPLIAIHEFGHYAVARLFGVKVLVYSIGFGPQVLKWTSKKTGIVYQFAALPLGGYVKMLDERNLEGDELKQFDEQQLKHAFNRQSVWKRFLIVFAGPAINLIFAVLLFWVLFLPANEQLNTRIGKILPNTPAVSQLHVGDKIVAVDGQNVKTWQNIHLALVDRVGETGHIQLTVERDQKSYQYQLPIQQFLQQNNQASPLESLGFLPYTPQIAAVVAKVHENSAAFHQGMKVGDQIVEINGQKVNDWYDVVNTVRHSPEKLLKIDVLRQGNVVSLNVMPQAKYSDGVRYGSLGIENKREHIEIPNDYKQTLQYSPAEAFTMAVERTWQMSGMIVGSIVKMVQGLIGLDNISGPISVAKVAGQTAEMGWQSFLGFMAMMSISLGILNLLPIPMLDGGHLLYYIVEMIRGKAVSEQIQILGFKLGMLVLGSMMLLALFNDFMRL
ncbi:MAG: RIP metalloprotease RseP [Acinetobacter sp.]|nr:RIP metalloprotease RseP [Acinetobacter sp.]